MIFYLKVKGIKECKIQEGNWIDLAPLTFWKGKCRQCFGGFCDMYQLHINAVKQKTT